MRAFKVNMSLRPIRRNEEGSLSIETLLMAPLLGFMMVGMFVYFQIFRQDSLLAKSSYAVTDVISREVDPVNQAYVDNMYALLKSVSNVQSTISMRVGLVKYNLAADKMQLQWQSVPNGSGVIGFTQAEIDQMRPKIPTMDDQDSVIIVETNMPYTPPFLGGSMFVGQVPNIRYHNVIIMRSRFVSELCYRTGNAVVDTLNACLVSLPPAAG